mgnify:CR=1 FL=1
MNRHPKQANFYELRWPGARQSRLALILQMLDRAVDWDDFERSVDEAIDHPKPGRGRRPWPLATMLRISVLSWLTGANPRQVEDLLLDSPAACAFCRLDDTGNRPPDAETFSAFHRKLVRAGLESVDGGPSIVQEHVGRALARSAVSVTPGQILEPRWHGPLL